MNADTKTVLLYGDSNTHGTRPVERLQERRRFAPDVRWPGRLEGLLGPSWRIVAEGLPGRTTVHPDPVEGEHLNGYAVLPAMLASHRPLDLVVIMLGTNDLKARFAVTAFDIALAAERLVDLVQKSAAGPENGTPAVLLVAPPPIEETGCLESMFEGGAAKSRLLASHMAEAAARKGVAFLDAGRHAAVSPVDGIHLGAEDHERLAVAVADRIRDMF